MNRTTCDVDEWKRPHGGLTLDVDEVHVWRAGLARDPATVARLLSILEPDERQRADRFHFRRDRVRFIVARAALRQILAAYLGGTPERVCFNYSPYGKPGLAGAPCDLNFNVSHSNEVALYAFARGCEVGLDVEFVREELAGMEIARQFFSKQEVDALGLLPPEARALAFFNCWTRKEAYIKARGEGLSHPLDRFAVSLAPGEPAAIVNTLDDPLEVSRWWMHEPRPGPGYVAALALRGAPRRVRLWEWAG
ncbi:MAG: 4'-phosphopantetheinyl transferase family protein [Pyrinomonadaceae bacterium]